MILPGSVSASLQNSAEVVDFAAPMNGTYTIRIHNSRFTANTSTYLGVAWNKDTSDTLNPLTGVTSFS